ncbi:Ribonuclease H [Gracilaria domingensis]|nr:Ribonuclease H [Gracilaria domingensis]
MGMCGGAQSAGEQLLVWGQKRCQLGIGAETGAICGNGDAKVALTDGEKAREAGESGVLRDNGGEVGDQTQQRLHAGSSHGRRAAALRRSTHAQLWPLPSARSANAFAPCPRGTSPARAQQRNARQCPTWISASAPRLPPSAGTRACAAAAPRPIASGDAPSRAHLALDIRACARRTRRARRALSALALQRSRQRACRDARQRHAGTRHSPPRSSHALLSLRSPSPSRRSPPPLFLTRAAPPTRRAPPPPTRRVPPCVPSHTVALALSVVRSQSCIARAPRPAMVTTARGSGDAHQHDQQQDHHHHQRHRAHRHHHHRRRHRHRNHPRRHHHHHHHHHRRHSDLSEVANVDLTGVQPSNVGGIEIFADAVCTSSGKDVACGYGVVCDEPHARIAEPMSSSMRGDKHYLHALLAAMQFAQGVRAREITIYLPHSPTAHYYNNWLHRWVNRDFRRKGRHSPRLPGFELWRHIELVRRHLMDRGANLIVDHIRRRASDKMREAHALAQFGTQMHVVCPLCQRTHARQFGTHHCQPLCNYDQCKNRRFPNLEVYQDHLRMWHQRDCPSPECEDDLGIYSDKELRRHLKQVHGMKYGCDFCGRLFDCPIRFREHPKKCVHGEKCRDCGRRFTSRREANIHRERAAHGDFDGSEYDSDESSSSSSSSTSTTSLSSDYEEDLTYLTSKYG